MNQIINNFLLAGDKFMSEMHLRQCRFTYCICEPVTKNKEKMQKFEETGNLRYIYPKKLDKACFQHDMAYRTFKDLPKRTASGKVFNIAKNPKYDRYQSGIASMVYKFFDKKSTDGAFKHQNKPVIKRESMPNQQLVEELGKPIIRKFEKRKVYWSFKDNI